MFQRENIFTGFVYLFFFLLIFGQSIFWFIDDIRPRDYLINEVMIKKATIRNVEGNSVEVYMEESDPYATLKYNPEKNTYEPTTLEKISIDPSDLWVVLDSEKLPQFNISQEVGAVVIKFDVYKKNFFGKKMKYESSFYQVVDVYDSYENAINANLISKEYRECNIVKKVKMGKDKRYFLLEYNGKKFQEEVSLETYDKYEVKSKVTAIYEGPGQYKKLVGIS